MDANNHRPGSERNTGPSRARRLARGGNISACFAKPLFFFLLPLMLLFLLFASGCGNEEPQIPGAQFKPGAISRKTAAMADRLDKRLKNLVVTIPAKKYQSSLQVQQRLGSIEIPRIGIREWIIQGTSTEELKMGAGHIEGTSIPGLGGNFGIAGDRVLYSAPFLRMEQLVPGDEVLIHMPYADFTYLVENKTNVLNTEVSVLKPRGYDSVTLSTCDPPWQLDTRMIIFAKLAVTEPRS
ncbi:MAG: class E sortase [Thermoleophilia bacterium]|nr:class E sortase [Thermoleophilia bacterium]